MDYIVLFENLTSVHVKDSFVNQDKLIFVVEEGKVMKAIGKSGANIRRLEQMLKRKIKIVEFSEDICKFVKSFVSPIKADSISFEEGILSIAVRDTGSKGLLIGRDRRNLKNLEEITNKYFKGVKIEIR